MSNILLIIICISSGYALKLSPFFNDESSSVLNRLIIYFFIPLIALYQVPKIKLDLDLVWLSLCPFIVFFSSFLFFQGIGKFTNLEKDTKVALILTSGISSTSFVGFPIFELLYGEQGLAYGILMSLGGTILVFNTLGISTLLYYTEDKVNFLGLIKKIARFIPFIAFVIAFIFNLCNVIYPKVIDEVLAKLVSPFSVIALISIGMQVKFKMSREIFKELLLGQLFKLILAPLIIFIIVWCYLDIQGIIGRVCVLGAAIGSMNAMSILTAEKNIKPKLSILMPTVGIPISIPILFVLDQLLK